MGLDIRRREERLLLLKQVVDEGVWIHLAEGVACQPGSETLLSDAGSLVFDIDGVLIDTHHSFREVIPLSVNIYMGQIAGNEGDGPWMSVEDGFAFQRAGGFNNDWDIAEAGLILALWKCRDQAGALPALRVAERVASEGGGLGAVYTILELETGAGMAGDIVEDVDRSLLERIFKELYIGGERYREVFGHDPEYYLGPGGMEREKPLVDGTIWERTKEYPVGILTGRIPEESELALDILGMDEFDRERLVTDDGQFPPKPDPKGFLHLAGALNERPLLYFGDNRDDLTTLLRARAEREEDEIHFVYCLSGSPDSEMLGWFISSGAAVVAVDVEDALAEVIS